MDNNTTLWDITAREIEPEAPVSKFDAFIGDLHRICIKHGITLIHEEQGIEVHNRDKDDEEIVYGSFIDHTND